MNENNVTPDSAPSVDDIIHDMKILSNRIHRLAYKMEQLHKNHAVVKRFHAMNKVLEAYGQLMQKLGADLSAATLRERCSLGQ